MITRTFIIFLLYAQLAFAQIRYVSTSGSSSNDGLTEATAWSFTHADNTATAGMTVYVKAGNYGAINLSFPNAGTSSQPIRFIGYKNSPGDIVANEGSTFSIGDNLDASEMPLLDDGPYTATDNTYQANKGTAISIAGDYVQIHNIQVTRYRIALSISANSEGGIIDNLIFRDMGYQGTPANGIYQGFGVACSGNNWTIRNSYGQDATAEGFKLANCTGSKIEWSHYYGTNNNNPTDYYFLISGGSSTTANLSASNNSILNCHAERFQGLSHNGHGFDLKGSVSYSVVKDCYVKGTNIEAQFSGVHHNTYENIVQEGYGKGVVEWHTHIRLGNGAHDNLFKNITTKDADYGIIFEDTDDGWPPIPDTDAVALPSNNTFFNCGFQNLEDGLETITGSGGSSTATGDGNTLINCTFENVDRIVSNRNVGFFTGTSIINSSFSNSSGSSAGNLTGFSFDTVNFFNNSYSTPSGNSITTLDPQLDSALRATNPALLTTSKATAYYPAGGAIGYLGASTPQIKNKQDPFWGH